MSDLPSRKRSRVSRAGSRRLRVAGAALFLAAATALTACGGGGSGSSGGADDKTIEVWTYYTSGGQLDALKQQNAMFEKANPGVTIKVVQIPFDQLPSKLLATATTQDGPDLVLDNVVVDFPSLVGAGVLADLTSYWNSYADKGQFPDSSLWTVDDKIYNVMSYTNLLGLYYNKDALDKLGIEPPTSVEEFETAMQKVAADGTYTPLAESAAPTVEGAWMFMPLLLGDGTDYCNLSDSAAAPAFSQVQEWAQNGWVPKEAATWDQADAWQAFISGKYAFGINGNWNLGDVKNASFEIGTTRFPAGPDGSKVFPGGEGIGVGAFAGNKDLVWKYVEDAWMSKDASLINFKASGQIPTRGDLADDPSVTSDELVTPFVQAAAETSAWPKNEQTAAMQTAIGKQVSAVISGQSEAAAASKAAVSEVEAAKSKGGGSC